MTLLKLLILPFFFGMVVGIIGLIIFGAFFEGFALGGIIGFVCSFNKTFK